MAITVSGTSITFNDATVQTTAASGPPTTLYAIGTYVIGRAANVTNYTVNSTLAGSSLYATAAIANAFYGPAYDNYWSSQAYQVLVNTGSWRCVSPAGGDGNIGSSGLWVRYA